MPKHPAILDTIVEKIDTLSGKVGKIELILTGNGTPEKGMIVQLDRVKIAQRRMTWVAATLFGALAAAVFQFVFKLL